MRVLVTGGSGFLGAWVMRRLLARELNVRAFDVREDRRLLRALARQRAASAEWQTGDISSASDVARYGPSKLIGMRKPKSAADPRAMSV